MVLIIGLVLAAVFALTCDKLIKKHSNILYIVCVILSLAVAFIDTKNLPAFVNTYIIGLFSRGAFATSLWIIVMWTGALKNGSRLIKKLMPIRGELSIMAGILTLSHNISFGKIYFVRLFVNPESMSATHLAAAIMSLIMLLIMIPLTIMSFPKIRKKMNGKLWKKIQRTAYVFYALIYAHVLTLYIPMAHKGNISYWAGILTYSIIFIGYAVCRIRKWYILRKKPEQKIIVNIVSVAVVVTVIAVISILTFPSSKNDSNTATVDNSAQSSNNQAALSATEAITELITESATENITEKSTEAATESSTESSTEEVTQTAEEATVQGEEQIIIYEQANDTVQSDNVQQSQTDNSTAQNTQQSSQQNSDIANNIQQSQQQTQQQAPQPTTEKIYVYNNGTYTATAFGYDGDVQVSVTIENDVITNITGTTYESDDWYFNSAKGSVFSQILSTQQTNVDAYSGATYSSKAIMTAVQAALDSARK